MLRLRGETYKDRMEHAPRHSLLEVSQDEMDKVRHFYNIDINAILQDLEVIEEWGKKQDHLVEAMKYLHREILERFYLIAKGSVEATKNMIEKLFTMRGMMSELALNKSIGEFNKLLENIKFIVMPKLTEELSRVTIIQFATGKWDDFNFQTFVRYYFMLADYRLHFDYNLSETFIVDLKNLGINDITRFNPMIIKKAEILSLGSYGVKINSIHLVNAPSFVDTLITIVKQALRENLVGRLHVHSTYDDLYKAISKDIIPEDYGGNSLSVAKLSELWQDCFTSEEARQIVENNNKLVSDESKRSSFKFNEEYLGMPGSFKKLALD